MVSSHLLFAISLASFLGPALSSQEDSPAPAYDRLTLKEILIELEKQEETFSYMFGALNMTGYLDELDRSDRQWTLFSPPDDSFVRDRLPNLPTNLDSNPKWIDHSTRLVGYHLVGEKISLDDWPVGETVTSVEGSKLAFDMDSTGRLTVNGQSVIPDTSIQGKNGVIHGIDGVVVHQFMERNVKSVLANNPTFSILNNLMTKIDVISLCAENSGPLTLFAPENSAFEAIGLSSDMDDMEDHYNEAAIRQLLMNHVIPDSNVYANTVSSGEVIPTCLSGSNVMVTDEGVKGANLLVSDIMASDGAIVPIGLAVDDLIVTKKSKTNKKKQVRSKGKMKKISTGDKKMRRSSGKSKTRKGHNFVRQRRLR